MSGNKNQIWIVYAKHVSMQCFECSGKKEACEKAISLAQKNNLVYQVARVYAETELVSPPKYRAKRL